MDGFEVNAYVIHAPEGDIIVDAGAEPKKILAVTRNPVSAILITHGHADHTSALVDVYRDTRAPIYMHPEEEEIAGIEGYEPLHDRSEERRVGKECRSRWS